MTDEQDKNIERFEFDDTSVEINEDDKVVVITLPDGEQLTAAPEPTEEYEAKAKELGYENGWGSCREHDTLHAFMAACLHMPYSPTLWDTAHGENNNQPIHIAEEEMVLAAQRFINLAKTYEFKNYLLDNE